jgi:hypothetical protein
MFEYKAEALGPSGIRARVVEDSISEAGVRLTTLELHYPAFIHPEFLTHRQFSRNSASSRAVPTGKRIEQVMYDPVVPVFFGVNQPGMVAEEEVGDPGLWAKRWEALGKMVAGVVEGWMGENPPLHKQIASRPLQPWLFIDTLATATEWANFFRLRLAPDAQPEMQKLAKAMQTAMSTSDVSVVTSSNSWHLPYVTKEERAQLSLPDSVKVSVARCARVAYAKHGALSSLEEDLALHDRLKDSKHMSPFEHAAAPIYCGPPLNPKDVWSGNFRGWNQYRQIVEVVPPYVKVAAEKLENLLDLVGELP